MIENHIYQGNKLNINPDRIVWTRALDMNDRSLRSIFVNANGTAGDLNTSCTVIVKKVY